MRTVKLASLAGFLLVAGSAVGQVLPVLKYSQPWNCQLCNYESRVDNCTNANPLNKVALDDWVCPQSNSIHRITWWGWIFPGQGQRQFLIAIFNDNGNCQPNLAAGPIFQDCVTPTSVVPVGAACLACPNKPTRRLSAPLNTPFNQEQGVRYWLQISEDDQASVRPGLEDFRWSGHLPVQGCNAVESPPLAVLPNDPCWNGNTDLAFKLSTLVVHGMLTLNGGLPAARAVELRLCDGTTWDSLLHETMDVEPDGRFMADPSVPPGTYGVEINIVGAEKLRWTVVLPAAGEVYLEPREVCLADVNGDGRIDFSDINPFVGCLTGGAPIVDFLPVQRPLNVGMTPLTLEKYRGCVLHLGRPY
ncbi:MAG: hypothetical protein AB1716_01905 [Planctomycetota bacterium]